MPTKYPPRLSLGEAVSVVKTMYAEHQSREVSIDLMPEILQTKQGSSFFNDKISALQRFGFIQKMPNDLLYLTDLAMQIIKPIGNEDVEAKVQAFRVNIREQPDDLREFGVVLDGGASVSIFEG